MVHVAPQHLELLRFITLGQPGGPVADALEFPAPGGPVAQYRVCPVSNRSCTGIRPASASTFAGLPLSAINKAEKLTSTAPESEAPPSRSTSLPHRVTPLHGEPLWHKHAGESRNSVRDNTSVTGRRDGLWMRGQWEMRYRKAPPTPLGYAYSLPAIISSHRRALRGGVARSGSGSSLRRTARVRLAPTSAAFAPICP